MTTPPGPPQPAPPPRPTPPTPSASSTPAVPTPPSSAPPAPAKFFSEWGWYFKQFPGLLAGRRVPTYAAGGVPADSIVRRSPEDLRLILDVATTELSGFESQLEQIRQRAQFLFTTLLVIAGFAAVVLRAAIADCGTTAVVAWIVWSLATALLLCALMGAAGIIVNRKTMGVLSASWLTRQSDDLLLSLTADALGSVEHSKETVFNQLTYYRHAVLLTLLGTVGLCGAWIATAA